MDLKQITADTVRGAKDLDLVYSALDNIMADAIQKIYKFSVEKNINLRKATYAIAAERIYKALSSVSL